MDKVQKKLPVICPSCNSELKIGRLFCGACQTDICGTFDLPVLLRLSHAEQAFVVDFVRSSGSLKDMARTMGVSYPTVRNLLDEIIEHLNKLNQESYET